MINIVIGYDKSKEEFRVYEPTTDTLLITGSLGESFLKLSEFLRNSGMIATDILGSLDIQYHLDSSVFLALVESNVNLIKRLSQAPTGFMISSQKFGVNNTNTKRDRRDKKFSRFSNSSFSKSYKKFGNDS